MADGEAYMLSRDHEESKRLDVQHEFIRSLGHGHLLHPSIPRKGLQAVADVGTGTRMWLRDFTASLRSSTHSHENATFVGFDISLQQFPPVKLPGIDFVIHDITKPFPQKYHERFDLVHVRLLSYALKALDLKKAVNNVVQILRPGGFLYWQEFDAIDTWATPETSETRAQISYVVLERIARGLLPAYKEARSLQVGPWLIED